MWKFIQIILSSFLNTFSGLSTAINHFQCVVPDLFYNFSSCISCKILLVYMRNLDMLLSGEHVNYCKFIYYDRYTNNLQILFRINIRTFTYKHYYCITHKCCNNFQIMPWNIYCRTQTKLAEASMRIFNTKCVRIRYTLPHEKLLFSFVLAHKSQYFLWTRSAYNIHLSIFQLKLKKF